MRLFLLRVFGTRVLAVYGCISMLTVAVLAALYITSGYAIEGYVADQIRRIPWDISIIQRGEAHRYVTLQEQLRTIPGVQRIATMGFLRVRNTSPLRLEIDGKEFPVRWFGLIAASEPQLLPPETFPNIPTDVTLTVPIVRFTRNGFRNRRFQYTAFRMKKGLNASERRLGGRIALAANCRITTTLSPYVL